MVIIKCKDNEISLTMHKYASYVSKDLNKIFQLFPRKWMNRYIVLRVERNCQLGKRMRKDIKLLH